MNYIELKCPAPSDPEQGEILIARLADIGYESFSEEEEALLAYIPAKDFSMGKVRSIAFLKSADQKKELRTRIIEDQNWNAVWESNYPPVTIAGSCHVRAPFHEESQGADFDIVLKPKMAFGTAHHETTALMIELLLEEDCAEKQVLDMGCGTAVLAILASMKGAKEVMAIDNNEWAYHNSVENIALNNCSNIEVKQGNAAALKDSSPYELILANINKNILLRDIGHYTGVLARGGRIFLSGFYAEDLEDIRREAQKSGLDFVTSTKKNKWVAAVFSH
ncbi:MAG: 50S ribosomal protein L11 methyltransferase [Bacteroidales bacterium]|nr:50S ribosomal protein L11 methyltransferase [Bacteroidales bacterium]